jgi:MFS family permease
MRGAAHVRRVRHPRPRPGPRRARHPWPAGGIFANIAIYLPLTVLMARTKFTGHLRDGFVPRARVGAIAALKVLREVSQDRVLVAMIGLAGLGSFFVGSAMQTAMPAIAGSMGATTAGTAYGVLLFANGLGGVLGGILLEGTGRIKLSVKAAVWSTAVYGVTSACFAFTHQYLIASALLVVGGVANLAALSITQTVVQLRAPRDKRGQVIGVYGMSANGLRLGSGFTVGILGTALGLRASLGLSAVAMCACTALVAAYLAVGARQAARRETAPRATVGGRRRNASGAAGSGPRPPFLPRRLDDLRIPFTPIAVRNLRGSKSLPDIRGRRDRQCSRG